MLMKSLLVLLGLLLLAGVLSARPLRDKPNFSMYHTKARLFSKITSIVQQNNATMSIEEMQMTTEGYSVTIPVVTVERGGLSDNHEEKLRILMSFGAHAREIIAGEVALRLLQCLQDSETIQCVPNTHQYQSVTNILNNSVIKIIPLENPVGREIYESGEYCQRMNGRGVDLNRNWDVEFKNISASDIEVRDANRGDYPFSEPESVLLRDLARGFRPHVWVGGHSGSCAVFMPYNHIAARPEGPSAKAQFRLTKKLKAATLKKECMIGSGGGTVGYIAPGTATDYMYSVLDVPLAFTWEIQGDRSKEDCYERYNPVKKSLFKEILDMWVLTFFKFLELLPDHPDIPAIPPTADETPKFLETEDASAEFKDANGPYLLLEQSSSWTSTGYCILLMSAVMVILGLYFTIRLVNRQNSASQRSTLPVKRTRSPV